MSLNAAMITVTFTANYHMGELALQYVSELVAHTPFEEHIPEDGVKAGRAFVIQLDPGQDWESFTKMVDAIHEAILGLLLPTGLELESVVRFFDSRF